MVFQLSAEKSWKVIGFALLRYTIGLEISRHGYPIRCNTNVSRPHTFSRALRPLQVFALSFDWLIELSESSVIGQIDYFGFAFTALSWKPLQCYCLAWSDFSFIAVVDINL